MSNTALRAEAQSTNDTHMVFANGEHEKCFLLLQQPKNTVIPSAS